MYKGAGILFYMEKDSNIIISLGERAINPQKNFWSIPGGKLEYEDKNDLFKCALRETENEYFNGNKKEFTKIENKSYSQKSKILIPFIFEYQTFLIDLSDDININFTPNWEFKQIKWFNIDKLPPKTHIGVKYSLFMFDLYKGC